ncbi:MAG: hypothetical protein WC379_11775 [Methanoregula sp.]|jgi:hypothetical protein
MKKRALHQKKNGVIPLPPLLREFLFQDLITTDPDVRIRGRWGIASSSKKNIGHLRVIVLAGMHEDLLELLPELPRDRGALDKQGSGPDNGDDLQGNSWNIDGSFCIDRIIPLPSAEPDILPVQNDGHLSALHEFFVPA